MRTTLTAPSAPLRADHRERAIDDVHRFASYVGTLGLPSHSPPCSRGRPGESHNARGPAGSGRRPRVAADRGDAPGSSRLLRSLPPPEVLYAGALTQQECHRTRIRPETAEKVTHFTP